MIIEKNIKQIFQIDTLICSTSGQFLQTFMMVKHRWSEENYKEYFDIYKEILVKEANEI